MLSPRAMIPLRLVPHALAAVTALGCAMRPVLPPSPEALTKPLTFSILEDYDKNTPLDAIARDFDLFAELGVDTWRGSFGWDDYEPAAGRYDFAWLHAFMSLAASRGVTLRPYVAYTPAWAAGGADSDGQPWNQPPRDQSAWAAFTSALGREIQHHPNVVSLEIYNEQNVKQWWEGSREAFADTLRTAAAAVRGGRRLDLLAGGLVFPDLEWVEEVCGVPGTAAVFDVLPVHAYPETWTPAGVTVENYLGEDFGTSFARQVDRACGPKRIWINETGFATVPGKTEQDQAAWWVRAIATFAATPRVEHVGIYEIRDLAKDKPAIGDAPNYHLGLVRTDGTQKLAFSTVARLMGLFEGGSVRVLDSRLRVARPSPAGELHHRAFLRPDGQGILIVWNRTSPETVSIGFPGSWSSIVEYGIDGKEMARRAPGELRLQLAAGIPRMFRLVSRAQPPGKRGERTSRPRAAPPDNVPLTARAPAPA